MRHFTRTNAADRDLKRFATLQATAALAGVTLHQLDGDVGLPIYVATRWAMTKQFDDLDEIAAWLALVKGIAA